MAICEKETKAEEAKKPGFFGFLKGNSVTTQGVDYEALIRELGYTEDRLFPPENYTWLQLSFELPVGSVTLLKIKAEDQSQGLTVKVMNAVINFQMENESYAIDISLTDTQGESWEQVSSSTSSTSFYHRTAPSTGPVLQITHQSNPSNFSCRSHTTIRTQPIEIIYSPTVLERAASFFISVKAEQAVKTAALDKLHYLGYTTNEKISNVLRSSEKRVIELDLCAPVFQIPANSLEFFTISLGRFHINNRNSTKNSSEMYEKVNIYVTDVKITHVDGENRVYPLLEPVHFTLTAELLNSNYRKIKGNGQMTAIDGLPDVNVFGRLEKLQVNCTYHIYRLLIETWERIKKQEEAISALSMDKKTLMKTASAFDLVSKPSPSLICFCVLSQDYLYFFNSPNDPTASAYFHLFDCRIETDTIAADYPYLIRIKGKFDSCSIAFPTMELMTKWQMLIIDCISEPLFSHSHEKQPVKSLEIRQILCKKLKMTVELQLSLISIQLTDDFFESWFVTDISEVKFTCFSHFYILNSEVKLRKLVMFDRRIRSSERFSTLAKSMDEEKGLIDMCLVSMSPLHPDFKGVNQKCEVRFHSMALCWNMETLVDLMNFVQFRPGKNNSETADAGKCVGSNVVEFWLDMHFDKVDLMLNNVESEITLAKASVQEFDMRVKSYACKQEIEGKLGNIFVYDLTDYPRTALKKYLELPNPFCLFSLREGLQQLLHFSIKSYSSTCQELPHNCDLVLDFHLSSVKFVYLHQPIMRIVDFFLNKILRLFDTQ